MEHCGMKRHNLTVCRLFAKGTIHASITGYQSTEEEDYAQDGTLLVDRQLNRGWEIVNGQ